MLASLKKKERKKEKGKILRSFFFFCRTREKKLWPYGS